MKLSWKIGAIIGLVAVIAMGAIGISYSANGNPNPGNKSLCTFSWVESNDSGSTGNKGGYSPIDPGDNGNDPKAAQAPGVVCPRTGGDVASLTETHTKDTITMTLSNAYPGYNPTLFFGISNQWSTPGIVQSINIQHSPELAPVTLTGISVNQIIESGQEAVASLSVKASDNIHESTIYQVTATIVVTQYTAKGTLNITTPSLPGGEVGIIYNQALAAAMGNTPYAWSLASGTLPTGLSLNGSGVISGTPAATGTYSFTVKVTDVTNDTATKALSIKIVAGPTVTTSSLAGGKVGKSYSETLAVSGGVAPYTWAVSSGSLPNGLTLNAATGVISGTPAKAGTYSFSVRVTDVLGAVSPTKSLSIVVK
jgi:hypothetical protein